MRAILIISTIVTSALLISVAFAQEIIVSPENLDFGNVEIDDFGVLDLTITSINRENTVNCLLEVVDEDHFRVQTRMAEATAARNAITAIYNASLLYRQINGEDPHSVSEMWEMGYLEFEETLIRQWSFTLIGSNPITQFEAVSTDEMPGGAGHLVLFDVETQRFSGYGDDIEIVEIELRPGENQSVPVTFMPDGIRDFDSDLHIAVRDMDGNLLDEMTVDMHGSGCARAPSDYIDVSSPRMTFGMVDVGDSRDLMLTVTNHWRGNFYCIIQSNDIMHFRVRNPEALAARDAIIDIHNAAIRYRQDNGNDPASVEELIRDGYLVIDRGVLERWSFTLIGSNPIVMIEAVSTAVMQGGAGHVIIYDIMSNSFAGYEMSGEYNVVELLETRSFTSLIRFIPDEYRVFESFVTILILGENFQTMDQVRVDLRGTGVDPESVDDKIQGDTPGEFSLSSVYPNPFNGTTNISFSVTEPSRISLGVYNISGRMVALPVNAEYNAGWHEVIWDASGLPSGLYFACLTYKKKTQTAKMLLVR